MRTIKNISTHVEELHDGRPIAAYESRQITDADFKTGKDHYEQRVADGVFLLVDDSADADSDGDTETTAPARRGRQNTQEGTS